MKYWLAFDLKGRVLKKWNPEGVHKTPSAERKSKLMKRWSEADFHGEIIAFEIAPGNWSKESNLYSCSYGKENIEIPDDDARDILESCREEGLYKFEG